MPAVPSDGLPIEGYTAVKELGRGGMGCVWLAQHNDTGRIVAVKMMLPQVAANDRAVSLFRREVISTRILQHPNIVRFEEEHFSRGVFFLVLEYCDGGSAAGLMKQCGGVLPPEQAVHITLQAWMAWNAPTTPTGRTSVWSTATSNRRTCSCPVPAAGAVAKVGDFGFAKAFDVGRLERIHSTPEREPAGRRSSWPASR